MELEELKKVWDKTDNPENVTINKLIFREIIDSKLKTSREKLLNYEWIFLILEILAMPLIISISFMKNLLNYTHSFLICALIILMLSIVWDIYKIRILDKINLDKPLKNNIIYTEKYKHLIKIEKLTGYYFVIPFVIVFALALYAINKVRFELWICMFFVLLAAILFVVFFYKIYDKHICNLRQSLEELKALEEDKNEYINH